MMLLNLMIPGDGRLTVEQVQPSFATLMFIDAKCHKHLIAWQDTCRPLELMDYARYIQADITGGRLRKAVNMGMVEFGGEVIL